MGTTILPNGKDKEKTHGNESSSLREYGLILISFVVFHPALDLDQGSKSKILLANNNNTRQSLAFPAARRVKKIYGNKGVKVKSRWKEKREKLGLSCGRQNEFEDRLSVT